MYLLFPSNQNVIIGKEIREEEKKERKKERIKLKFQK